MIKEGRLNHSNDYTYSDNIVFYRVCSKLRLAYYVQVIENGEFRGDSYTYIQKNLLKELTMIETLINNARNSGQIEDLINIHKLIDLDNNPINWKRGNTAKQDELQLMEHLITLFYKLDKNTKSNIFNEYLLKEV